jgi:2-oxoisovalerate dehydrogenase E1 component alpha subunit
MLLPPYLSQHYCAFKNLTRRCLFSSQSADSLLTEQYQHDTLDSDRAHAPFSHLKYQSELKLYPSLKHPFPAYRILMPDGNICHAFSQKKKQTALMKDLDLMKRIYLTMLTQQAMDKLLHDAQRQGRISFFLTGAGEEAAVISSAAALKLHDFIYAQYREPGALLLRGYPVSKMMNQVFSNRLDEGQGRQMPVHYGSKELNYMTISSPLSTQIPQAAGAAYALKRENQTCASENKRLVACYFGVVPPVKEIFTLHLILLLL